MNKLNQTLLKFELEQNFAYDDFFVSKLFTVIFKLASDLKLFSNIYFLSSSHLILYETLSAIPL